MQKEEEERGPVGVRVGGLLAHWLTRPCRPSNWERPSNALTELCCQRVCVYLSVYVSVYVSVCVHIYFFLFFAQAKNI